jgi:hypothetical protein
MKLSELDVDVLATALAQQQSDVRKLERRRLTEAEPTHDIPGGCHKRCVSRFL